MAQQPTQPQQQYLDVPPGATVTLPGEDDQPAATQQYADVPPGVQVELPPPATNSDYGKSLAADMGTSNPTTPTHTSDYNTKDTGNPFEEPIGALKEAGDMAVGLGKSAYNMATAPFREMGRVMDGDVPKDKTDMFNRAVDATPVGAMLRPNADLATKMLTHAREAKAAGPATENDWATKLRGAQLGVESLIPFAGPMAEALYEREMGSSGVKETRQNTGRAATDITSVLAGTKGGGAAVEDLAKAGVRTVKRGIGKVRAPLADEMAKLPLTKPGEPYTPSEIKQAAAAKPGVPAVPLTAAQITRNPTLARAESAASKSAVGDTIIAKQKAQASSALDTRANKAITDLGGGKPYRGATDVGQQATVKASIQSDLAKADAKVALDDFETKMKSTTIDTEPVRDWASGQASKFGELFDNEMSKYSGPAKRVVDTLRKLGERENPAAASADILGQMKGMPKHVQDQILTEHGFTPDAPATVNDPLKWDTVRGLKSDFYDLANDPNATPRAQGLAKQATAELEDLLQGAVKGKLGAKGVVQYRAANQKWADWQDQYNDPQGALKRTIDAKYGKDVTSQLVGGQGNPQIIRELGKAGVDLGPLKQQVASRIMNQKWRLGGDGTFGGYKGDFLTTLFTPDELKGLQQIGQMSRGLEGMGEQKVSYMGKVVRTAFRNPMAAKLLTSKWFTKWMTNEGISVKPSGAPPSGPPPKPGVKTAPTPVNPGRPTASMTSGAGGSNYTAADLAALKAKHKIPAAPGNVVGGASLLDDMAAGSGGGKKKSLDEDMGFGQALSKNMAEAQKLGVDPDSFLRPASDEFLQSFQQFKDVYGRTPTPEELTKFRALKGKKAN